MGRCYDPSGVVGHGCRAGMQRLRAWARREFGGGDLGCFNPNSRAGSGPSLHADGRADDIAFNANDPADRVAGDRFFHWIIEHHHELGLQETLWRGFLWSCQNAHLGIRGPGIQQAPHMNHVHWGVTYEAANDWQESWLLGTPATPAAPLVIARPQGDAVFTIDRDNGGNRELFDFWTGPDGSVWTSFTLDGPGALPAWSDGPAIVPTRIAPPGSADPDETPTVKDWSQHGLSPDALWGRVPAAQPGKLLVFWLDRAAQVWQTRVRG